MTREELTDYDQRQVMVSLDGAQAMAQLWAKLFAAGPVLSWPIPADGLPHRAVFRPLTDEEIAAFELNGRVIFSHLALTSEELTRL